MADEIHDAYRGTVRTTFKGSKQYDSVAGVGLMITDTDTGERKASISRPDGTHQRISPSRFEQLYLGGSPQ